MNEVQAELVNIVSPITFPPNELFQVTQMNLVIELGTESHDRLILHTDQTPWKTGCLEASNGITIFIIKQCSETKLMKMSDFNSHAPYN